MPWKLVKSDGKVCVHKENADKSAGEMLKCYDNEADAVKYMRALYANVNDSSVVEMSMAITKASFDKKSHVMRWRAVASDTDEDLYDERMSLELFEDFISRIEDNDPLPAPFDEVIKEDTWNGGMPYLSIAHYKSGIGGKNIAGDIESIYIDGKCLKAKGTCRDNELGLAVFNSLCEDLYSEKSGTENKIRISIGFLDLEHKHMGNGMDYVFTRKGLTDKCPLCSEGISGKIYTKGQLVHLALTRIPVNPRTEMELEEKSMTTKREDAESIIKDKADLLIEESQAVDAGLVIKSEETVPVPAEEPIKKEVTEVSAPVVEEAKHCDEEMEDGEDSANGEDVPAKKEKKVVKSAVDVAFDTLKSKILEVKSSGLTGDDALAQIQPEFNSLGNILKGEFTTPQEAAKNEIADVVKSAIAPLLEKVVSLETEIAQFKAKSLVAPAPKADEVVKSRSLKIPPVLPSAEPELKSLSQIDRLARGMA